MTPPTWQELAEDRSHIFALSLVDSLIDLEQQYGRTEVKAALHRLFPDPLPDPTTAPPVPAHGARNSDPDTSHDAAEARHTRDVGRFSMRSRQAELLRMFSRHPYVGLTAQEATAKVLGDQYRPSQWEGTRRRCSDLVSAGLVEQSAYRKINPGGTERAIVLRITELGKAAWKHLEDTGWSK